MSTSIKALRLLTDRIELQLSFVSHFSLYLSNRKALVYLLVFSRNRLNLIATMLHNCPPETIQSLAFLRKARKKNLRQMREGTREGILKI